MPKFAFRFLTAAGKFSTVRFSGATADKALRKLLDATPDKAPTIGQLRSISRVAANRRASVVRRFA